MFRVLGFGFQVLASSQERETRNPKFHAVPRRGAAVISTLLVLTVLTIMVVAFLQSMRIDRLTARSYLNKTKAEMAAQAGLDDAQALLINLSSTSPDLATAWESFNDSNMTTAYFKTALPAAAGGLDPTAVVFFRPLVSGSQTVAASAKSSSMPVLNASNSVDVNSVRLGEGEAWVGTLPGQPAAVLRAPWVTMNATNGAPLARYAFWIEDESFKVNVNTSGDQPRAGATPGATEDEIALQGVLLALKSGKPAYSAMDVDAMAAAIKAYRLAIPAYQSFFDPRLPNRVFSAYPRLGQDWRFIASLDSGSLNLSRHGSLRLNLNAVVQASTNAAEIRTQLDRIIQTIEYHLPSFGQRFYRTDTSNLNALQVAASADPNFNLSHEQIYLEKLAANLRDFIDSDNQPTVINNDPGRSVRIGGAANQRALGFPVDGAASDAVASGKENVPYVQEYALRARTLQMSPPRRSAGLPATATYRISMDHYFEFWNPATRDITPEDLGPNAFIKVYAQPAYDTAGGTSIPEGRDFQIPLTDFVDGNGNSLVFRAGQATVLTTDSDPSASLCPNPSSVFRPRAPNNYTDLSGGHYRLFNGTTSRVSSPSSSGWFRVNLVPRSTSQTDYLTEMLLGNDQGIIDGICGLPIPANLSINDESGASTNPDQYFFRGGSLRGNSTSLNQVADPRTNAEQLFVQRYRSGGDEDQTRYYNNNLNNNSVPGQSNFGNPINGFTDLSSWPDRILVPYAASAGGAPYYIGNSTMRTIGELGHVADPARGINTSAGGIYYSRGGGRTLRIGQSDNRDINPNGLWDGNRTSTSSEWAAWRLTDLFSTQSDLRLPGRINLNGVLRDNGTALRAALYQLTFGPTPETDTNLAGKVLLADNVVNAVLDRVAPSVSGSRSVSENTIFWERGAISEIPLFYSGPGLAGSTNTTLSLDRGREELGRRLIELVCTRGDTFTLYVVGQSLQQLPSGSLRVLSTHAMRRTVRLRPVFAPALNDSFDPSNPNEINNRFRRPDRYELQIIR